ncbi:ABC transporter [Desulfuribacillus stibiiarsenatis]|uniref:ABC transporter n=1 Tax=Desulfuribacillus stibiiarsenatis TaxID=1390249 RepID=A0A1E5L4J1_9FIRM|nr:ABC transporter ATP-binding protein [Desulfuribacillus stibiiarsenatis]OEH85008.1 ABC transporter [Desulfuribacillus stibiiarsenatis]
MIEAKNISLTYKDGTVALRDVNLTIKRGELVYITGPSGSGKTSLLKLFLGMEYVTSGKLEVSGVSMVKGKAGSIRNLRKTIGPVFQEFKLIEGRTALENVMMGMRFLGMSPKRMKEDAMEALVKVGLEHKIYTSVEHLSWGQAQRVAIARAVSRKPALIIADEPTGNLDRENAVNILNLLASFQDQNTTVILTTHATHLIEGNQKATFIRVKSGEVRVERGEQE